MRLLTNFNFIRQLAGVTLLFLVLYAGTASAVGINPALRIDGIPPIGNPSFSFDAGERDFGNTINRWFSNMVYLSRTPSKKRYKLYAFNQGAFTYDAGPTESYSGRQGNFQLRARFNRNGSLIGGSVVMTGVIKELGINRKKVLYRGTLQEYATHNKIIGFSMNNIRCAAEIVNCQDDRSVSEGIYIKTNKRLPRVQNLGERKFATTVLANTTTVPLPAGVWLMLSGLGALGLRARLKRNA